MALKVCRHDAHRHMTCLGQSPHPTMPDRLHAFLPRCLRAGGLAGRGLPLPAGLRQVEKSGYQCMRGCVAVVSVSLVPGPLTQISRTSRLHRNVSLERSNRFGPDLMPMRCRYHLTLSQPTLRPHSNPNNRSPATIPPGYTSLIARLVRRDALDHPTPQDPRHKFARHHFPHFLKEQGRPGLNVCPLPWPRYLVVDTTENRAHLG